jgi:glycosyltransferase involved in cell wall biosynthesis
LRPHATRANPYAATFGAALERAGATTAPFSYNFLAGSDAIILHWPQVLFQQKNWVWFLGALRLLASLAVQRARGARIIWVVHNLAPHDVDGMQSAFIRHRFFALLDGLITLSPSSHRAAVERYPELAGKSFLITAHGNYDSVALSDPSLPVGVPDDRPVTLGSFGKVRPYKGLAHLLSVVAVVPPDRLVLEIAGKCPDEDFRASLVAMAASQPNLRLDLRHLPNKQFERRVDGADGIVLPYSDILNSGSALYALSRYRPILAPALGSLPDLQREVGPDWLSLYEGPLTAEILTGFTEHVRRFKPTAPPDLSRHDWAVIGHDVHRFLTDLAARR